MIDLSQIPWLQWFASGLDAMVMAEARKHPYFIPWLRETVNDACDRAEEQIYGGNDI